MVGPLTRADVRSARSSDQLDTSAAQHDDKTWRGIRGEGGEEEEEERWDMEGRKGRIKRRMGGRGRKKMRGKQKD